jgi:hypothetical protein
MASDRVLGPAGGPPATRPEGPQAEPPAGASSAPGAKPDPSTNGHGSTLRDPLAEALRLIDHATAAGLQVRLMGGLAFHAQVPDWTARIERERRDIDLATRARDRSGFTDLMTSSGYLADRQYNALYGHKQLYFVDEARGRPVDVLVDRLEMSHTFEFGARLALTSPTLPLAELLLSKLQVAHINRKDILDAAALLSEYPLGPIDDATINLARITALTSNDWGWWRTVTGNIERIRRYLSAELQPGELDFGRPPRFTAASQLDGLRGAVDEAAKSTRWKIRARLGERVQWFDEPEEVGHGR